MNAKNINIPSIEIREAVPQDAQKIADLSAEIFLESFNHPCNQNDMDDYIKRIFNKQNVLQAIAFRDVTFFVTTSNNRIIGFVKIVANQKNARLNNLRAVELRRLYIQKDMAGKNIGCTLMEKTLEFSNTKNADVIWLSVWENNERAIKFYNRFKFEIFGEGNFALGKTERKYLLMKKILTKP